MDLSLSAIILSNIFRIHLYIYIYGVSDIGIYAPGAACASLFLYKYFLKVLLYISRNTVRTRLLQELILCDMTLRTVELK